MDYDRNQSRGKSEDGYSGANRSNSSSQRGYRENNYRRNDTNQGDNSYKGNSNSGRSYGNNNSNRPYGNNNSGRSYGNNNSNRSYGNNRSYNNYGSRDERPVDDHPYSQYGNNQNKGKYRSNSGQSDDLKKRLKRPRIGERIPKPENSERNQFGRNQGNSYRNNNSNRSFGNNENRPYNPNAKYSQKKQLEYKEALTDPNQPIRLNKYLANAGVCSRREADEFIQAGVVKVNGEVITELGHKVFRTDNITFHDEPVSLEKKAYVLLNKPKNCVTTSSDPEERLTVMDLVKNACNERIYPVGRLDRNTTGVLLLTNDGELASKLTHPKFIKKKIYHVVLDKALTKADMQQIADGIELEDGKVHADAISYAKEDDKKEIGIEIHIGKNRIVRRIFDHLGYKVMRLDRVYFAGLTKKNLPRGKWRYLSQKEVDMLKMGAFE